MTKPTFNHFTILPLKIEGLTSHQFLVIQKALISNNAIVRSLLMTTSTILIKTTTYVGDTHTDKSSL